MELIVWKSTRGLASCDSRSLYILAYCRMAKIPDLVVTEVTAWNSLLAETFPRLVITSDDGLTKAITGPTEIVSYLRGKGHGIDSWLTASQSAESCALESYVFGSFVPAVEHILWVDENNRSALPVILGSNFFSTTVFSNFVLPFLRQKHKKQLSKLVLRKLMSDADLKSNIYHCAKECLSNLSSRLSNESYFCGSQPCYLDALVLSFLLIFKQFPSTDRSLANYISQCPNLDTFAKRLSSSLFAIDLNENSSQLPNQALTVSNTQVSEFPHAVRNTVIASIIAVSAIMLYMVSTGMLKLEFTEDDSPLMKTASKKKTKKASRA